MYTDVVSTNFLVPLLGPKCQSQGIARAYLFQVLCFLLCYSAHKSSRYDETYRAHTCFFENFSNEAWISVI